MKKFIDLFLRSLDKNCIEKIAKNLFGINPLTVVGGPAGI
jgi:hypothetical protein